MRFRRFEAYSRLDTATTPRREIMPQPTSPARELIRGTVPKLAEISDQVIYGDVWERPGLSKRDRSLITVAALVATAARSSSKAISAARSPTASARTSS